MQEENNEIQADIPTEHMPEDKPEEQQGYARGCSDSFAEIAD